MTTAQGDSDGAVPEPAPAGPPVYRGDLEHRGEYQDIVPKSFWTGFTDTAFFHFCGRRLTGADHYAANLKFYSLVVGPAVGARVLGVHRLSDTTAFPRDYEPHLCAGLFYWPHPNLRRSVG